jgi:hypothetical protein
MNISDWSARNGINIEWSNGRAFVYVGGREPCVPSLYALSDCCVVSRCGCVIYLRTNKSNKGE